MVREPNVVASLAVDNDHNDLRCSGALACERIQQQIDIFKSTGIPIYRGADIELNALPPQHAGFGSGTQIACAIATLIRVALTSVESTAAGKSRLTKSLNMQNIWPDANDLFRCSGRGKRSSIGVFGFLNGGLIVDKGHSSDTSGRLSSRVSCDDTLYVLLATPRQDQVIAGANENRLIAKTAGQANPKREAMWDLIQRSIIPSLQRRNYDAFGESLYEYGMLAGFQFKEVQGGLYRNQQVESLVAHMRRLGIRGVCQSSWGPTVFGLTPDHDKLVYVLNELQRSYSDEVQLQITTVLDEPATVLVESELS